MTLLARSRISLGPALVGAFVLAALVPALLVAWLLSSNSSQSINTLAENAMGQAAHRVDVGALAHLGESHTVVNALVPPFVTTGAEADRTRNWLTDTASFETMAYALTQQSPNVPYLYFGTSNGTFFGLEREPEGFIVRQIRPGDSGRRHFKIAQPGDRSTLLKTETHIYDPRKRPWYQLATTTGKRSFTDVYRSAVKAQFDLTLAQPIFDASGQTILGVVAVDMSLARLTDLIRSTRISENAVTYLVDSQGLMVASSVDEELSLRVGDKFQRISPLQSQDALVRESFAQLSAQVRGDPQRAAGTVRLDPNPDWAQRIGLSSNRLIALQRPFGRKYDLDWQLIVVAPESDFTAQVTQARQWALLAMAALIGLSGWLAYSVARRLSHQFRRLNESATAVGAGEVPPIQERARFTEVHHLSQVMHDSALKLRAYNDEIQHKNEALRDAALLLEERVHLRTAELAASREEALGAVKAKAGFLAVMSHEIRTPLHGVVGMGELLNETALTPTQKDLLGVLKVSSAQLLSVVDDILDFSKIESGKLELEHLPLDLYGALHDARDLMQLQAREKGLQLDVHIAPDVPPAIMGDITRLRQVLLNLLSNAVKFTHRGEITLRVWIEKPGDPMTLCFSVTDTGVGIGPHRIADLFQPFAQGDTSTARVYGGTGLGLMICKHLVELMGGHISVSSEPGAGSTFRFTVQAQAAHASDVAQTAATPLPHQRHSERVLVVDDNPVNLKVASAMLDRLGYPHDTASGGEAALQLAEQAATADQPYALVLLDSHMPGLDGVNTARALQQRLGARAPVIVGVSASTLGEDRQHALDAGMVDYLAKPLELQTLDRCLQQWLGPHPASLDATQTTASTGAPASPQRPWVDPRRWESFAEFDDGQDSLWREVMGAFVATMEDASERLHTASNNRDLPGVREVLHLLKGAAANAGAAHLAAVCEGLERALQQGVRLPLDLVEFDESVGHTGAALADVLKPPG
ncbi:MAG: ATP-binding protein [Hydrogenophaga sp.]|nr:ATP-binding protein [Hydrogenophaga sp.]